MEIFNFISKYINIRNLVSLTKHYYKSKSFSIVEFKFIKLLFVYSQLINIIINIFTKLVIRVKLHIN